MLKNLKLWLGVGGAIAVVALVAFFAASDSVALQKEGTMPAFNHYKCYPVLDWVDDTQKLVKLTDQFGTSEARLTKPAYLCNPVDKNGEGIANQENHLVCYTIYDDPVGSFARVKEVLVDNQFGQNRIWIGLPGRELCVPSTKQEVRD